MPASSEGHVQPWFTPTPALEQDLIADTYISVRPIIAVAFKTAVTVTIKDAMERESSFSLTAYPSYGSIQGIDSSVTHIKVDTDSTMLAMKGSR